MKIFKFMVVALVAMIGLNSCSKDCDHDFIEYDYSEALVGTWTYVADNGLAEAMIINPDGSFNVIGVMKGGSLYEEKGTIKVVNNKVSLVFEGDGDVIEGRLELVAGKSLSIVLNEESDICLTYDYCENDLSDEIVGMWVCNDKSNGVESNIAINTYKEDGTMNFIGVIPNAEEYMVNITTNYKVVGNLLFTQRADLSATSGVDKYVSARLDYAPNGTAFGDIMIFKQSIIQGDGEIENTSTYLRVKQNLNLTGKKYAYKSAYISNAKGTNEDFSMMGSTFNMANIEGSNFDDIFGDDLYSVELNANSIVHKFRPNGHEVEVVTPITVNGNKVTLDMSTVNPACRTVEMYMFQDADDSQLHIYMPTQSFINYFANLGLPDLIAEGKNDAAAIEKFYTDMEARIESINVSFVFKARK